MTILNTTGSVREKVRTMRVLDAGYYFIGLYCLAPLRIILEGGGFEVEVNPKFFDSSDMYELFQVFDIDYDDTKCLQDIVRKCCRVCFDENRRVVALQHLTKDNIIWYVKREDS